MKNLRHGNYPRSCVLWVKGKARNRILFLNPGQVLSSLDYNDRIALEVCLFGCKMFCVSNQMIMKTVINTLDPPNQRLAGQVHLNYYWKPDHVGRLKLLWRKDLDMCDLVCATGFIMIKEWRLAIRSKHCKGKIVQNWACGGPGLGALVMACY